MKNSISIRFYAVFISMFIFLLLTASESWAARVEYVKEYSYQASEADSKLSCRAIVLEQIKRLLLEELGSFLISETRVKDFQLTKDQIVTYTAGSVSTVIVEEKWNGQTYFMKAKLSADPDEVAKSIDELRHDKDKSLELEEMKEKADRSLQEIARLKKELALSRQDKIDREKYNKAVSELQVKELIDKGLELKGRNKYDDALELFTQAITLQPSDPRAYTSRGIVYRELEKYDKAIKDFDKALSVDPSYWQANMQRGYVYLQKQEFDNAIRNFTRAIELSPDNVAGYNGRCNAYNQMKQPAKAIRNCSRAIEINPKFAPAYVGRGNAYKMTKDYARAISDFTRALELDPGLVGAFYNRAITYNLTRNEDLSIEDYKSAARLNHTEAQDILRKKGISW